MKREILWITTYKYTEIIQPNTTKWPQSTIRDRAYYYIDVLYNTGATRTYTLNWDKCTEWDNVPEEVHKYLHKSTCKDFKQWETRKKQNGNNICHIRNTYMQFPEWVKE